MSEVKTDSVVNVSGDNDSGIDLSTNDVVAIKTADSERVRVDASGNVGIGTTSPGNKLHVHGAGEFNSYDNTSGGGSYNASGLLIGNAYDAGKGSSVTDDRNAIIWNERGLDIDFGTNNAQRMKLTYDGNVTIGKTSAAAAGDGIVLYNDGFYAFTSSTTGSGPLGYFYNEGATSNGFRFASFRLGSFAEVGTITTNGTNSTSYNTTSDHRLKENVADMTGAIARVKQLAPKRFNFINDADTTVDGFIAHEAQAVVPEAVTGTHNEVDDDGNAVYQGIDQAKLVPLLVGALKEAITKIETLETKVTALENA